MTEQTDVGSVNKARKIAVHAIKNAEDADAAIGSLLFMLDKLGESEVVEVYLELWEQ